MEQSDFARMGGKARWKGTTKKQRIEAMKYLRSKGKQVKKQANTRSLGNKKVEVSWLWVYPHISLDEQAREV